MTNRAALPELLHLQTKVRPLKDLPPAPDCRQLRLDAGVAANLAGAVIDTSQSAIYRWESGETSPKGATRLRYLRLLAVFEKLRSEL